MSTRLPPLDWPHVGIGFLPAVQRAFQKYATFSGRASRSEFWWWTLGNGIVVTVLYGLIAALAFGGQTPDGEPGRAALVPTALLVIWALAVVIPSIALTVRRLHDAGQSGWFYLFSVFGLGIVTLVFCAMETSPNAVRYGPPYPQGYGPGAYGTGQPGYAPPPGQQY